MKKTFLVGFLLFAISLFAASAAQEPSLSIAFVNSNAVITAHPSGQQAAELEQQLRADIEEIRTQVNPLAAKLQSGETLTAEERSNFELLQRTAQETQQTYQEDIQEALQPAVEAVNAIIAQVAEENGYTLVLNRELAATSSLVVYGDPSIPDITEEVIARVQTETGSGE